MGMHDCPFLVVFDINEDLKFAKICFFEEGNITSTGTYMFSHLGEIFVELQAISQQCF